MLRNMAFKKIIVASLSFIIMATIYFFPSSDNFSYKTTLTYSNPTVMPIYLIDNNNYVARYNIVKQKEDSLELVDYIIKNLTITEEYNNYLPNGFKAVIPKSTVILDKSLKDNLLKINFSKEFLLVKDTDEEKMLEAIIYSLLEIKDVEKIMLFVEGDQLTKLPNNNKSLPQILDKNYGINKDYDIHSLKDISKITTYYLSKYDKTYYYVPVTSVTNVKKEKIEVIIEKLKTSPTYQTNLISFLASRTELMNYEILENSVSLSFNNKILNLEDKKISEEVKYSIALSIRDTYNINQTIFYVEDSLIDAFNLEIKH